MFIVKHSSRFIYYCPISNRNGSKPCMVPPTSAKKEDFSANSSEPNKPLKLPSNRTNLLVQSGIGVFALGFIDAGYSGDWSRIGVVSTETEDLLKAAAFLVVPFCLFLIFSLSQKDKQI